MLNKNRLGVWEGTVLLLLCSKLVPIFWLVLEPETSGADVVPPPPLFYFFFLPEKKKQPTTKVQPPPPVPFARHYIRRQVSREKEPHTQHVKSTHTTEKRGKN